MGRTAFHRTLSGDDEHDWLADNGGELERLSSRVSPNGRFLAFMSNRSLTGYDNRDANPLAHEARDQEVFLYDARKIVWHAHRATRAARAPHGVFDTENAGEGLGLLVDRPEAWAGRWLAGSLPGWTQIDLGDLRGDAPRYQSRYLSDSGRLFFNSTDALIPQQLSGEQLTRTREEEVEGQKTQVGVENVYEYEPKGVGGCQKESCVGLISSGASGHESAFLDASESGDDVYFITAERLVATDLDTNYDVYDARACTAESPMSEIRSQQIHAVRRAQRRSILPRRGNLERRLAAGGELDLHRPGQQRARAGPGRQSAAEENGQAHARAAAQARAEGVPQAARQEEASGL